jgi:queuine tRNA-ribosyltransferase
MFFAPENYHYFCSFGFTFLVYFAGIYVDMDFRIKNKDKNSKARCAILSLSGIEIETPVFMPVGTLASVKTIHQPELEKVIDAKIVLANAYHLMLRPGVEVIQKAGGLHSFQGWNRCMLTDSGGYQVYSLSSNRKISEEGVFFQSHIDGKPLFISPEISIDIQRKLGADCIMAFDECTPYPCDHAYAEKSMHLTHKWLLRCMSEMEKSQALYDRTQICIPIIQGSVFPELRKESAAFITDQNSMLNAIGGLSVGEPHELMYAMTALITDIVPENTGRYLMGVGTPENILEAVSLGVDMFDCVLPTRNARHGLLYTQEGIINIKNEKWKYDFNPINSEAMSFIDEYYSRAYVRHLMLSGEYLALQIASLNNLVFYSWLMKEIRKHIQKGDFLSWKIAITEKIGRRL